MATAADREDVGNGLQIQLRTTTATGKAAITTVNVRTRNIMSRKPKHNSQK